MKRILIALWLILLPAAIAAQDLPSPSVTAPGGAGDAAGDRDIAADAAELSAQVDDDRGFVTRFIERNLSGAGRSVVIEGFEGALSSRATFERMTIADADGVWITLVNGALQWNRSALFQRRIDIRELSAAEIHLTRLPRGEDTGPTPEVREFQLPTLPVGINIAAISVGALHLGEAVLGEPAVVTVNGAMNLAGGAGEAQLGVERVDGRHGVFAIDAAYSNTTTNLRLDLTLDEAENGLFANLVDLYGRPSVAAEIKGEGPLQDFAAEIRLATDGQDRVTGRASARAEAGEDGSPGTAFRLELSGDVASLLPPENRAFFGQGSQLLAQGWRGEDGRLSLPVLLIDTEALNLTGSVTTTGQGAPQSVVVLLTLGEDAGAPTLPVRLPLGGTPTEVRSGSLQISYDAAQGSGWTLAGRIGDLSQGGTRIGALTMDGGGSVRLDGGTLEEIVGRISFGAQGLQLADAGMQAALGDSISGETGFDLTPGNALELSGLTVTGADYTLQGDVLADGLQSGITLSGRLEAAYQDLSRLSRLAGRPLAGRAEGSIAGLYTVLTGGFDAEAALTTTDVTVDQPQLDRLLAGEAGVTASARRDDAGIEIRDLTINAQRLTAQAQGIVASDATDLRADLRLASLTDADPSMAGSLTAQAALTGAPGSRRLNLTGDAEDLVVGITELDGALQGTTSLTLIAQETDGGLGIETLRLANPQLTVAGEGSLVPGALNATLDLQVPELAVLGRGFSGALDAQATISESDGTRFVRMQGTGEDLRLGQQDVDGALTGTTRLALAAEQRGDVFTIRELELANQQMEASVAGVFGPGVTDLDASVDIRSLASFGRGWQGALRLDGSLADDGTGVRRLAVDGVGRDLSLGQANVDGALLGETRIAVRASEDDGVFTIEQAVIDNPAAQVNATGTIGGETTDLRGRVDLRDLSALGLGWAGSFNAEASFADDGTGARRLTVDGTANDLSLGQAQADAALAGPTRLTLSAVERGGVFTVESAAIRNERLGATAEGTVGGGQTDLTARLNAASLAFLGRGIGGAVDATARVVDQDGGRRITAEGTASNLRIGNPQADALLSGQSTFSLAAVQSGAGAITVEQLNARNDQLNIRAQGSPQAGMTVDASLADLALLVPGLPGAATVQGTVRQGAAGYELDLNAMAPGGTRARVTGSAAADFSTADIRVAGVSDAALANPFLRVRSIEGPVDFDLRLNGPPALESLSGTISLPGARLSDPKLGLLIENLSATARLDGGRIGIDASGNVGAGGRLTVMGTVDLRNGMTMDLAVNLDGVVLRDPNLYETVAFGRVTVTGGGAEGPLIAGTIDLGATEIRIPSTGLGGARAIPDIAHLNDRPPVRATRAKAGLLPFPSADSRIAGMASPPATPPAVAARLDVTINAPNQVFVRGRGVDAELGGQLRLTGNARNVIPVGQLELIRGRVDLLGRRFDLTEGLVEMQGSLIPVIRLVAETVKDGITTRIVIDGEIRDPEIIFESNPELPQEEVLSQLLFGRGLDAISPLQAAQLANAVAVLAGRGGEGIIASLRNAVGLDDLDLATDDDGNVTLRAGRYLSENLYTDVSVDAEGKTRINLNLDVGKAVTARGSVDSAGESTLGVYYERDY